MAYKQQTPGFNIDYDLVEQKIERLVKVQIKLSPEAERALVKWMGLLTHPDGEVRIEAFPEMLEACNRGDISPTIRDLLVEFIAMTDIDRHNERMLAS
jgi:hypothetical protein